MTKPLFVILHGSYGSPDSNWFPALKQRLERLGQEVIVPRFPVNDWETVTKTKETPQSLQSWMDASKDLLKAFVDRQAVVVAHSLGPLFALHLISKFGINIDCLIAVSPFLDLDTNTTPEPINISNQTFYDKSLNFELIKKHIGTTYVLYSENDPYVPKEKSLEFANKLGAAPIMVRGAGHMNAEINMNEFPLVVELCKSRIDLTLYQKYLDHRAELFTEDTAKYHTEGIVNVSPQDMFDEGIFKFRNLRKYGFCTLPTNALFWEYESVYMKEARLAAKRLGTISRVFLVDKPSDLDRLQLQKQIEMDLKAGFLIYLCDMRDVEEQIGATDFGIWDDEYVCIVTQNDGPDPEVLMTSRQEDIPQAHEWKEAIMKHSTRISNLVDIKTWLTDHSR
jgi:uncharacterized protein